MKIYLVDNHRLTGSKIFREGSSSEGGKILLTVPVNIDDDDIRFCSCNENNDRTTPGYLDRLIETVAEWENYAHICIHLLVKEGNENDVSVILHGFIWEEENKGLLFEGLKLRVQLSLATVSSTAENPLRVKETGLMDIVLNLDESELKYGQTSGNEVHTSCTRAPITRFSEVKSMKFPLEVMKDAMTCIEQTVYDKIFVNACYTLTLFTDEGKDVTCSMNSICKKIHDENILSDVTLIAGNGAKIPCHRSFLAAHSSVFAAMFKTDLREKKTSQVELDDMTEEGVRAFLTYLYTAELKEPRENSLIAFEMLETSHKYLITELEEKLKEMLLQRPNNWYDVDVTLRIFLFARNLDGLGYEKVQAKAVEVMRARPDDVQKSAFFKDVVAKNSALALELITFS